MYNEFFWVMIRVLYLFSKFYLNLIAFPKVIFNSGLYEGDETTIFQLVLLSWGKKTTLMDLFLLFSFSEVQLPF